MQLKLITNISFSLLKARFKQTLVAAVGVTFSIAMFITLLSFMGGLNDMLDGLILNRTPHVRLYKEILASEYQAIDKSDKYKESKNFVKSVKPKNERTEIYYSESIIDVLNEDKDVKGISRRTSVPIFYSVGQIGLNGMINGVDVEKEVELFTFDDYITEGNSIDLNNVPNSIILGSGVARRILTKVGETINVKTSDGNSFPLKVVGIFQSGLEDYDKVQSFCNISTTQKILGKPQNYITDIQIKLYDLNKAPELAKKYRKTFGIQAIDIQTANAQFETGTSIRNLISYAVGITLLVVAGFGIYNILNMMIYEKMDSIAILKATGFSGKDVNMVFIEIALTIGIVGGFVGLLIGLGLSYVIDQLPFETESLPTIKTFPVNYNPMFYIIGASFSIITTYFSGYFPARKASKIDPVEIIRGK